MSANLGFLRGTTGRFQIILLVGPVRCLPERYALTCFAVLLMEMAGDATLNLNLRGNAQYVSDWFVANAEGLETVSWMTRRL